jgi:exonuclease VII large subunit
MSKLAKTAPKSLQIKEGFGTTVPIWKIANKNGTKVVRGLQKLAAPMIKAGAAFWVLRSASPKGEWEATLAARSQFQPRTVHYWITTAENALQHIGYAIEDRAMQAIIAERQDQFGAALLTALNDAIAGKSARQLQLEFGIRKPAHPLLPPSAASDGLTDEEREQRRIAAEICKSKRAFEDGLAHLQQQLVHINDADRAAIGYACARQVAFMLPDGWKLQVVTHTGRSLAVEQVFAEHLGLQKPS